MVTAPLVFAWVYGRPIEWTWPRVGEGIALLLTLFGASQLMFGLWGVFATRDVPIAFVFFPIVGWAGLRFGARGSTTIGGADRGVGDGDCRDGHRSVRDVPGRVHAVPVVPVPRARLVERPAARRDHGRTGRCDDQAAAARRAAAPFAEDGSGRPPRRRHRPRLQQPAHRDHRLHRDRAALARSEGRAPRRRRRDRARRDARRRSHQADAGVQPPPGAAAEGHRPEHRAQKSRADAAARDRRRHRHDRDRQGVAWRSRASIPGRWSRS